MFNIVNLPKSLWPSGLMNIPCPPKKLTIRGFDNFKKLIDDHYKFLTVVGSRKFTEYGEAACKSLIRGLINQRICIVSGLAYGIDCLAHQTAIESGLPTIAFPGSGLKNNCIYPTSHLGLANEILKFGGSLISELDINQTTKPWMFPQRNRLMVGISHAILIIEAAEKSGSGISANMAVEYDRELMAVPGSIFNHNSVMTNRLIKEGASPIQTSQDILQILDIENSCEYTNQNDTKVFGISQKKPRGLNTIENSILKFIQNGLEDKDEILKEMKIPISEFNRAISRLEIMGLI